jgi:hypothetical protein
VIAPAALLRAREGLPDVAASSASVSGAVAAASVSGAVAAAAAAMAAAGILP